MYFKAALDNLYQIYHIYCTKYTIYFKTILNNSLIQTKFCFKPIPHITYTSSKVSKNISIFFGYYYKYFEKKNTTKFKYKNTPPGEQKGEAIVYSVQQLLNLILYRSNFRFI